MPPYLQRGSIPRKRHIIHRREGGHRGEGLYYEEVVTTAGFGRAYSICYHLRPPTRVVKLEPAGEVKTDLAPQKALRHHHLKSGAMKVQGDPVTGRVPLLVNDDVSLARCRPAKPQAELFRNATADEVIFVHRGIGTLHTMFGSLPVQPFDYVVIPRCTTYRLDFEASTPPDLLVIEGSGTIGIPARYLNPDGQLRLGAPYAERDLHGPASIDTIDREEETPVVIKDGQRLTRYVLASHPFDLIGWDGPVLAFIEVKARHSPEVAAPEQAVSYKQRRRITKAAEAYLRKLAARPDSYRFDVISVFWDAKNGCQVRLVKNAFSE